MSDVEYDFAEILRSPLDPDPDAGDPKRWAPVLLVFLLGAAVAAVGISAGLATPAENVVTAVPDDVVELAPESPRTVVEAAAFPAGYTPIASDVAVQAEAPIIREDRLLVPMTMIVRRGVDPTSVSRPLGARWEMRTTQGVVESRRTLYDPFRPSVFSVEFPAITDPPQSIVMVERWDGAEASGGIELDWPGVTYRTDAPIVVDLGNGAALTITALELGNFLGRASWQLDGAELGVVRLDVELLDDSGELFGAYASGLSSLDAAAGSGFIDYFWEPGFRVDQDDAARLRLTATVDVGTPAATEIEVTVPE